MALFDSDFLSRLEYLSLVCRRVFQGQLIAQKRTHQPGAGIEFADHREYAYGDDFRYLDWNLYARHEQLLLKRFQQEQDLHVYVLLDCSRSMAFGEQSKFDHARRIAAAMAYIALADLDRVAVLAFAGDVIADFPLSRGKARIVALMRLLEQLDPAGSATNLQRAAGAIVHRAMRPGPAIIISDLYDPEGYQRGIDLLRYHRFEPHVIRVFDHTEVEPTLLGDLELVDCETDATRIVTVTQRSNAEYRRRYDEFVASVRTYCRNYGLNCTEADTAVAFDDLILQMMRTSGVVR